MVRTTSEGILRGNFGNDGENNTHFRVPSAIDSFTPRALLLLHRPVGRSPRDRRQVFTSLMISPPPHITIALPHCTARHIFEYVT